MNRESLNPLQLHSAGATVIHKSPFESYPSLSNDHELTIEFLKKWAKPYYMELDSEDIINKGKLIKDEIKPEVVKALLGDFNWRIRQVGAFFAAIKNYSEFIEIIGIHLLKSEVCDAGKIYAYVFGYFNTPDCVSYLKQYLDYYLSKPNLYFDQHEAMEAIVYLDKINQTNNFGFFKEKWLNFLEHRPIRNHEEDLKIMAKGDKVMFEIFKQQWLQSIKNNPPDLVDEYRISLSRIEKFVGRIKEISNSL